MTLHTDTSFLHSPELPGLFIDALVTDETGELLFISAWGSESYVQPIRARFSLPVNEHGLASFRASLLVGEKRVPPFFDVCLERRECLADITGRPAGQTLFIHLTQWQVYNRLATAPDQAQSRALLLKGSTEPEGRFLQRLWQAVQAICRIPLHSAWELLLRDFEANGWVMRHRGFNIEACVIQLPEADVE